MKWQLLVVWLVGVCFFVPRLLGDEGMFPISELERLNLRDHGLELDATDLFNPGQIGLVDGICRVNGCTGSFVSDRGLIITNHHCAYEAIQNASSTERDLLENGFAASQLADEIPAPGYTVRITESYKDISDQVLSVVHDAMPHAERTRALDRRRKELEQLAEQEHPGLRAEVAEMFQGKTYVLFLYTYLTDVRLVFAPPASIGNFGGEVDNWEWPRHTGDFSFLRAYTAPDGSSADYSTGNVPYKPKRFIQVNPAGVDEGSFVFLLGYPGRTVRHKTASFLQYEQGVRLPAVVDVYQWQIAEMEKSSLEDRGVAIQLSSRIKSLANVEKRSRGQLRGLQRAPIVKTRQTEEANLQSFIQSDSERSSKYGSVLDDIASVYQEMTEAAPQEYHLQQLRSACQAMGFAFLIYDASIERAKPDLERESPYMDRNFDQTIERLKLDIKDWHAATDARMLAGMLQRLAKVGSWDDDEHLRPIVADPANFESTANRWIQETRLGDSAFVDECLKKSPEELAAIDDPVLQFMIAMYPRYILQREVDRVREGRLNQLYGLLIEVKQAFLSRNFVPDANGTLRLTFGRVRGYSPGDAIYKSPISTLRGVIEKTTGQDPFRTPEEVIKRFEANDFGAFAHPESGQVPVAILYNTDTTGGNSGSPVLDKNGQLVGVNFDRTFEATINDFAWNENYSRSIGVDVRYALWITGVVYGAEHLLQELGVSAR